MKFLVSIFTLLFSISSFANAITFEVQTKEISIGGNLMPNLPVFKVKSKQSTTISTAVNSETGKKTIIQMVATDDTGSTGILMKFTISEEFNGTRRIIASPQIIASNGKEARITEGNDIQPDSVTIAVVAKRVQ
jgi:type II secretory pathway component HofQ